MTATTNIYGFNIGGNNNSFDQRGHFYRGVFSGNVSGMLVKQNSTPNMTVLVEHGSALLNKNTTSASVAEIKADTSVTIDTANTSNPRIDTVVIYEDTSVAIPTVENNYWQDGAGGRFKTVSLPGTAAASPVALSDANIQSAIGAGKPWTRLADITVPANSTTIVDSNIADKRVQMGGTIPNKSVTLPAINGGSTSGLLTTDASGAVSSVPQYPTAETATNTTYNGKTVYVRTFTGTITASANARINTTIIASGVENLLDIDGWWTFTSGYVSIIGAADSTGRYSSGLFGVSAGSVGLVTTSEAARTNAAYMVRVFYTKV